MQRGMAPLVGLIRGGAKFKEGLGALTLVIPDSDHQGALVCPIGLIRISTLFQLLSQLCNISLVQSGPEGGLSGSSLRSDLKVFAQRVRDPYQRDDNDSAHNEWEENAFDAMEKKGAKTFPPPQHGGEVSTDQEK